MADFSTWERATLEKFAREATEKLIENREAIAELMGALKSFLSLDRTFTNKSIEFISQIPGPLSNAVVSARKAVAKHELTTKEQ